MATMEIINVKSNSMENDVNNYSTVNAKEYITDLFKQNNIPDVYKKILLVWLAGKNPLLIGHSGIGKSATVRRLSELLNFKFKYISLSMVDDADVGLLPNLDKELNVFKYAVPEWFVEANKYPTIVMFDEINRCNRQVLNAALSIFSERQIGNHKLNDNVFLIAAGNPEINDAKFDYDVIELDLAQKRRFVQIDFHITLNEWIEIYAKDNIENIIISFLQSKPEYYFRLPDNNINHLLSPSQWEIVSNLYKTTLCNKETKEITEEEIDDTNSLVSVFFSLMSSVVGVSVTEDFKMFLKNYYTVSIKKILSGKYRNKKIEIRNNNFIMQLVDLLRDKKQEIDIDSYYNACEFVDNVLIDYLLSSGMFDVLYEVIDAIIERARTYSNIEKEHIEKFGSFNNIRTFIVEFMFFDKTEVYKKNKGLNKEKAEIIKDYISKIKEINNQVSS